MLRKEDEVKVKKCMEYELEGPEDQMKKKNKDDLDSGQRLWKRTVKHVN